MDNNIKYIHNETILFKITMTRKDIMREILKHWSPPLSDLQIETIVTRLDTALAELKPKKKIKKSKSLKVTYKQKEE